ncbi:hypothetical protein EDD11_002695 [Mortierella claussenii]|nr:hypothetical protein EDD11_002695 [Mortierella claussenii]
MPTRRSRPTIGSLPSSLGNSSAILSHQTLPQNSFEAVQQQQQLHQHQLPQQHVQQQHQAQASSTGRGVVSSKAGPRVPRRKPVQRTPHNVNLTNANRKRICEMRAANPEMTLEALGKWAAKEFNLERGPAMGTLSRIINKQSRYSNMTEEELQSQRKRAVLSYELDSSLLAWIRENQVRNRHVSYKMITDKAKQLAAYIKTLPGKSNAEMPLFSNGWVSGFTKRHKLLGPLLNAPGVVLVNTESSNEALDAESAVGPPFPTDEELVQRSIEEHQRRALEMQEQDVETLEGMVSGEDEDLDADMSTLEIATVETEMMSEVESNTDLSQQVVHALKSGAPPLVETVHPRPAAPSLPSTSANKAMKPRSRGRPRAGTKGPPSAGIIVDLGLPDLSRQQHQTQPTDSGPSQMQVTRESLSARMSFRPTGPLLRAVNGNGASLTSLSAPAMTMATQLATAAPSSSSAVDAGIPTATQTIEAIRLLIKSLDLTIPAEADMVQPLFELERKFKSKALEDERQTTLLHWID